MKKALQVIKLRIARLWWVMIAVSALGTALGYTWWHFDFLDMSGDELGAYDAGLVSFLNKSWFPWGKQVKSEKVVLVAIDDSTFDDVGAFPPWRDRYGSWPYDRIIWHDIIEYLDKAGAKVVVMDVTLSENKADITGDKKMGEAIEAAKAPVVMGFNAVPKVPPLPKVEKPINRRHQPKAAPAPEPPKAGGKEEEFGEFPSEPTPEEEKKAKEEAAEKLRVRAAPALAFPIVYEGGLEAPKFPGTEAPGLADGGIATAADLLSDAGIVTIELESFPAPPIEQVIDACSGFGLVLTEADDDGKMRLTRFVYSDGVNDYVTLAVAVMADYWNVDQVTMSPGNLQFGEHAVRVNKDGTARLNYGGKLNDRFDTVSLADVLRYIGAEKDKNEAKTAEGIARFKDKIVFIGAIAQGASDQKPTPFNSFEPGVMKQMTEVDNMLENAFILEAPLWGSLLLGFLVALISVALVMVAQSFITDVGAPVALTFAFFLITGGFITLSDIHVLSAMPGMAGTLAALVATTYIRFLAGQERELLREAFSSYVNDDLLDEIVESRKLPQVTGERMEITAFFSDIRGFSTFTEQMKDEPEKVMHLMRDYLTAVSRVLRDHDACIDKFIGDAVVALFGAPKKYPDHALKACAAALAVQTRIGELREEFKKRGLPDVYTRIGLNTDVMLVGNMGSEDRPYCYTAIGDGMNLAARLEGTNKAYDTLILVGQKTADAVKGKMVTRELDSIRVAGKNDVTHVYELVAAEGDVPPTKKKVLDLYATALELYRHKRFAESLKTLKEGYDLDKTDGPTKVLAGKCNQFMQHPPPADWDGVSQLEK